MSLRCLYRDSCIRKQKTFTITAMMILVTFSVFLIPTVNAGDNAVTISMSAFDSEQNQNTNFDAGENVFVFVYFDPGNENMTMYNVSLLTFNETIEGLANATVLFYNENWTSNNQHEIDNVTGNITNINASGSSQYLWTLNNAFVVNLSLNQSACGKLFVNVSGVQAWENGTLFSTINYGGNVSIDVHPKAPISLSASTINSSAINITFSKELSADRVYIERNSVGSWQRGTGNQVGNVTGDYIIDNNGLSAETRYYYQAWSWNETKGWFSLNNISESATTSRGGIFINGTVVNFSDNTPIENAQVRLMKMDMGPGNDEHMDEEEEGEGDDMGDYFEFTNITDDNGYFEINLTEGGSGQYELEIEMDGYASYMNWSVSFEEDEYKEMGIIPLPMIFSEGNEATIKGYIENDSFGALDEAEIMLLNTNFNYMIEMEGMDGGMEKNTSTNHLGYYEINAHW
jgi:hypothetical protein